MPEQKTPEQIKQETIKEIIQVVMLWGYDNLAFALKKKYGV